ncbi:MAG: ribosome biogenesis GTP-binding protein YihA/YsxC [Oscillospiraceae bacterium]|nr:ribosome biogenesis GTP-binding protein YihA/YsxC [Oscillospiraceae bacterium]
MNLNVVEFIKSAADARGLIVDGLPQVVFSGRSNVGKSSVINKLLNRKNFARVASQPGKTVHINYFLIDKSVYFVDLPGYGYAKVSKSVRERWAWLMEGYFSEAGHIALGVMIVDARHKPTADDVTMAGWFKASGCQLVVVANKIDKLKSSEMEASIMLIRKTLSLDDEARIIPFSAVKGTNKTELVAAIESAIIMTC